VSHFKELFYFIKDPRSCKRVTKEYSLFFGYLFLFILLYFGLAYFIRISFKEIDVFTLNKKNGVSFNWFFFFKALVLAPLVEEIMFRLVFKPKRVYFLVILLPWLCVYFNLYFFIFGLIVSAFLLFFLITKYEKVEKLFLKNFTVLVYSSSIVFGLIHITNYDIEYSFIYIFLAFVFFLPKIIGGLSLIFIRIKFGFVYAILTHSFFNLLPMVIYFLVSLLG